MAKQEQSPFTFDENKLLQEDQYQPQLVRWAARKVADARHEHAKAEARLKVMRAEVKKEIRDDPTGFGLKTRPNKDDVEEEAELDDRVKAAVAELNEAQHLLDLTKADLSAYERRGKGIDNAIKLLSIEYFSVHEPRGDRRLPSGVRERDQLERQRETFGGVDTE